MRLNYDCIRDVLLAISELNQYEYCGTHYRLHDVSKQEIMAHPIIAGNYSYDDIQYSLLQLFAMSYLKGRCITNRPGELWQCEIKDITLSGHEFLDNIKEPSTWEAVKTHAKKLGAISMTTLPKAIQYVLEHPECIEQAKNLIGRQ